MSKRAIAKAAELKAIQTNDVLEFNRTFSVGDKVNYKNDFGDIQEVVLSSEAFAAMDEITAVVCIEGRRSYWDCSRISVIGGAS